MIENVNIGSTPNDGTGDKLRTAFAKLNQSIIYLKSLIKPVSLKINNISIPNNKGIISDGLTASCTTHGDNKDYNISLKLNTIERRLNSTQINKNQLFVAGEHQGENALINMAALSTVLRADNQLPFYLVAEYPTHAAQVTHSCVMFKKFEGIRIFIKEGDYVQWQSYDGQNGQSLNTGSGGSNSSTM